MDSSARTAAACSSSCSRVRPALDYADFGRYLTQQRELRGLSRDDVSKATKISPGMLAALEEGRSERLPGRVFLLNYIRAYAQAIGLEPDEAVLRFDEMDNTVKSQPPPAALERERKKRALWTLLAVLVGLGVVGYLAFGVLGGR